MKRTAIADLTAWSTLVAVEGALALEAILQVVQGVASDVVVALVFTLPLG
jgi:hypothetical protein